MNTVLSLLPEDVARMLGKIIPDEFDQKALQIIKHPNYQAVDDALMAYYRQYKVEMLEIFEENYPRQGLPTWVNYEGLRIERLGLMIEKLFDDIMDEDLISGGPGDTATVSFNWELVIALSSANFDMSRIDNEVFRLHIEMEVSFLELGG